MSEETKFSCPRCQFGQCRPGKATFAQVYMGWVMSAPDLPASVCDVCGYREFDSKMLRHVLRLMSYTSPPVATPTENTPLSPLVEHSPPETKPRDP